MSKAHVLRCCVEAIKRKRKKCLVPWIYSVKMAIKRQGDACRGGNQLSSSHPRSSLRLHRQARRGKIGADKGKCEKHVGVENNVT